MEFSEMTGSYSYCYVVKTISYLSEIKNTRSMIVDGKNILFSLK